ncbi:MAG: sulfatase [Verrucomicrobiota bacterium]
MKSTTSLLLASLALVSSALSRSPNFVVIFCDDLGYGDLGCYGSTVNRTPHLDEMAAEGIRLTSFYSSSPVCTPSRASLLTGCYAQRIGMHEAETGHWVLIPRNKRGMHPDEMTLPDLLKTKGYTTACIGKWHLGDQPSHLPTQHGFDEYYGVPYSNDMEREDRGDPPLPLVRGETVIEAPADQSTLTKRYTEEAISFLEANRESPFFLYLPHTFPHTPLYASPEFLGKSANGTYGDSVEEIDWSTGEILQALQRLKLDEHTLVIFTSDNGSNNRNGGSNAPLSGTKGGTMEGGMRVPFLARWPGTLPAGVTVDELATTMDLLPTLAAYAGAALPERKIDGHDIRPLLAGESEAASPYEVFYYYRRRQLQAIRYGDWKWHLPLAQTYPRWTSTEITGEGRSGKLVNLAKDLGETKNVEAQHPEVMAQMRAFAQKARETLGDEEKVGTERRLPLDLETSAPMVLE